MQDEDTDDPEKESEENNVGGDIVDGKSEAPYGQHCRKIAEDEGCNGPDPSAVARPAPRT